MSSPPSNSKKRSAKDLVDDPSRKKRKTKAVEWRRTWGRLNKPVTTSTSSIEEKVIARLWRGPVKEGEIKQSKCWSCHISGKAMPEEPVDGTEPQMLLGCGCNAQNALIEECLVCFGIFNHKQKKKDNGGMAKAAGKQLFQWRKLVKMMLTDNDGTYDDDDDSWFTVQAFFDHFTQKGWTYDGI